VKDENKTITILIEEYDLRTGQLIRELSIRGIDILGYYVIFTSNNPSNDL